LTARGVRQSRLLGVQLQDLPLDVCIHTRFARTRQTAEPALASRGVAMIVEPLLDDVDVGVLDGRPLDEYRAWKRRHRQSDRFPGGESLDEAALRYARAFRIIGGRPDRAMLVVCHEIAIRYALGALGGADDLDRVGYDVPNAMPFLFSADALIAAADRLEQPGLASRENPRPDLASLRE
jgi:probable phosphoglycerate mutase